MNRRCLKYHPAFGLWKGRGIDALEFQERLRSEWEHRESGENADERR